MPFWTYLLHCRGGAFYAGHTDDLEYRVAQHKAGQGAPFTAERLPVELVWSGEFGSRQEAFEFERRIKGWSRAKKMALIRGDWEQISELAKTKDGPSTSSGRAEEVREGLIPSPARLDKALAEASGLSRARIQALIAQGAVEVAGALATNPAAKVGAGTPYCIALPAAAAPQAQPEPIALDIAYEDAHLIVVNKPAGMVVHPAAGNQTGTLVNALLHHCAQNGGGQLSGIGGVARPGIVHRIDKDTSGLIVAAKTDAAHEGLARQFAAHSVHRRYLAVTAGTPSPATGTIAGRLGRSDVNRKKMAALPNNSSRGKHAVTHYTVVDRFPHAALIECRLETGRTHQVRVHCASIGHALLGDPLYGSAPKPLKPLLNRLGFARQALHARELGFVHPVTGERVSWTADVPPDMQELIDELGRFHR